MSRYGKDEVDYIKFSVIPECDQAGEDTGFQDYWKSWSSDGFLMNEIAELIVNFAQVQRGISRSYGVDSYRYEIARLLPEILWELGIDLDTGDKS